MGKQTMGKLFHWESPAAYSVLDGECRRHKVDIVFALFSGGHDSLVASHLTSQHPLFGGVLHIDTGIGIPETQSFVRDVCSEFGWHLEVYSAKNHTSADGTPNPQNYEDMVRRRGFPGPSSHKFFYRALKDYQISRFLRDRPQFKRIGLVTGIRNHESSRRMFNAKSDSDRKGRRVWISPIRSWEDKDCEEYMKTNNLPRNPVKDNLCMSGECLCGAFAQRNELLQIEMFYPEVAHRIRTLETEVYAAGFPWGWEEKPPESYSEQVKYKKREAEGQLSLPLCSSCIVSPPG